MEGVSVLIITGLSYITVNTKLFIDTNQVKCPDPHLDPTLKMYAMVLSTPASLFQHLITFSEKQ